MRTPIATLAQFQAWVKKQPHNKLFDYLGGRPNAVRKPCPMYAYLLSKGFKNFGVGPRAVTLDDEGKTYDLPDWFTNNIKKTLTGNMATGADLKRVFLNLGQ